MQHSTLVKTSLSYFLIDNTDTRTIQSILPILETQCKSVHSLLIDNFDIFIREVITLQIVIKVEEQRLLDIDDFG